MDADKSEGDAAGDFWHGMREAQDSRASQCMRGAQNPMNATLAMRKMALSLYARGEQNTVKPRK